MDTLSDQIDEVEPTLVECLLVSVPDLARLDGIPPALASMVRRDLIRILDLVCIVRDGDDARVTVHELDEVAGLRALADIDGEVGGLLSERDLRNAALLVEPGSAAIVLLIADRWAHGLAQAGRSAGGRLVGGERIAPSRIEAALAQTAGAQWSVPGRTVARVEEGIEHA